MLKNLGEVIVIVALCLAAIAVLVMLARGLA
jgi:hypothetical protein